MQNFIFNGETRYAILLSQGLAHEKGVAFIVIFNQPRTLFVDHLFRFNKEEAILYSEESTPGRILFANKNSETGHSALFYTNQIFEEFPAGTVQVNETTVTFFDHDNVIGAIEVLRNISALEVSDALFDIFYKTEILRLTSTGENE